MIHVALDQFGDHTDRDRLHLGRRNEGQRVDELVPRQREGEDSGRNQPGNRQRQDDLAEDLQAARAVDQRALL